MRRKSPRSRRGRNQTTQKNPVVTQFFYFFWSGPFSQWHNCRFQARSHVYNCAEQYMMHSKALLFGDDFTAEKILASHDPSEQKALGKQVKKFSEATWQKNRKRIVLEGNLAKFSQNKGLRRKLFQTGDALLVEASPIDVIWGIGLSETEAKKTSPSQWQGLNLLGKTLTEVRGKLNAAFPDEANSVQITDKVWSFEGNSAS